LSSAIVALESALFFAHFKMLLKCCLQHYYFSSVRYQRTQLHLTYTDDPSKLWESW